MSQHLDHRSGTSAAAATGGTQAVERVLAVLEAVAHGQCSGAEIIERTGLARSTALRLLAVLQKHRYVVRTSRGVYTLGPRVLELAARRLRENDLVDLALPVLTSLAAHFDETATLSVREGLSCVCIVGQESSRAVRLTITPGSRTPLHAGAAAKVLLAFAPETVRKQVLSSSLERFTPATTVSADDLRSELELIRSELVAETLSEIDEGVLAVAAPVFNASGDLAASVCLAGLRERISSDTRVELRQTIADAAGELSSQLGFSDGNDRSALDL